MTMAITFPTTPTLGQEYLADNGVTYNWMGTHWSNAVPTSAGTAFYTAVGGTAATEDFNSTLDGGNGAQ
jgi:hypothetical protein